MVEDDPAVVAGGALVVAGGTAADGTGAGVVLEVPNGCVLVVGVVCLGAGLEMVFPRSLWPVVGGAAAR